VKGETSVVVRENFEKELMLLQTKLVELAHFSKKALEQSMVAFETHDIELSLEIIEDDRKADLYYEDINEYAVMLIAKQQPVAIDLRRIIVAIKIATDLERIADFAVNIAKSTIRIGKEEHVKPIQSLKKMHEITAEMLNDALVAFEKEDIQKAKKVAEMDDQVDSLYGETIIDLFKLNSEKSDSLPQITQMLLICRFLERAADHITNIAEYVFYLVKGKMYDLNE
jgi:phosphate transport system protein